MNRRARNQGGAFPGLCQPLVVAACLAVVLGQILAPALHVRHLLHDHRHEAPGAPAAASADIAHHEAPAPEPVRDGDGPACPDCHAFFAAAPGLTAPVPALLGVASPLALPAPVPGAWVFEPAATLTSRVPRGPPLA